MACSVRPRRSVLYMPGSNVRALEKGRNLPADGLILDLEDAVAPQAKHTARAQVMDAVAQGGYGKREIYIRTNGLNTPWGYDDIVAAAKSGADAILLPKVESADTVHRVADLIAGEGAHADMTLWCMMETPLGILHAEQIAAAPRMGGFVMGTSDLAKDLHCAHTRDRLPMVTSLTLCLLAARAHGLAILDGVYLDLADEEGFAYACRQAVDFGFDGKTLIHPKTIAKANELFAPSQDQLAWSRRIIAAHARADAEGSGVVVIEGRLVENLHVVAAKRMVSLAEMIDDMATGTD